MRHLARMTNKHSGRSSGSFTSRANFITRRCFQTRWRLGGSTSQNSSQGVHFSAYAGWDQLTPTTGKASSEAPIQDGWDLRSCLGSRVPGAADEFRQLRLRAVDETHLRRSGTHWRFITLTIRGTSAKAQYNSDGLYLGIYEYSSGNYNLF